MCFGPQNLAGGHGSSHRWPSIMRSWRNGPTWLLNFAHPFNFDARAQHPGEAKVQTLPVFTAHDGLMSALYKRRYIETAQRFPELPRLTAKQIEALDYLDKTANDPRFHLAMTLGPGDLEIGNNATCFHARDTYTDHADPAARRCMLRLWLTLPNGRPLPKIYESTREWGPTYRRRMLQQSAPK